MIRQKIRSRRLLKMQEEEAQRQRQEAEKHRLEEVVKDAVREGNLRLE